jgi:hypothetical protein
MTRYTCDKAWNPVPEPDLLTWARWMEENREMRVLLDELPGGIRVSTVFLGLDHSFGQGPPVLFETMVFAEAGHPWDGYQDRYHTVEEAGRGHAEAVRRILAGESPAE